VMISFRTGRCTLQTDVNKKLFLLIGVVTVLCSLLMYVSSCSFGALDFCVVEIPHIRLFSGSAHCTPPMPRPPFCIGASPAQTIGS